MGSKKASSLGFRDGWVFIGAKNIPSFNPQEAHIPNEKVNHVFCGWVYSFFRKRISTAIGPRQLKLTAVYHIPDRSGLFSSLFLFLYFVGVGNLLQWFFDDIRSSRTSSNGICMVTILWSQNSWNFELQIDSICSIGNLSKEWGIFEKPLQLNFSLYAIHKIWKQLKKPINETIFLTDITPALILPKNSFL